MTVSLINCPINLVLFYLVTWEEGYKNRYFLHLPELNTISYE